MYCFRSHHDSLFIQWWWYCMRDMGIFRSLMLSNYDLFISQIKPTVVFSVHTEWYTLNIHPSINRFKLIDWFIFYASVLRQYLLHTEQLMMQIKRLCKEVKKKNRRKNPPNTRLMKRCKERRFRHSINGF